MIFVSEAHDGGELVYGDGKRYLWLLSVVSPLIPLTGVVPALYSGDMIWMVAPLGVIYIALPLLDWLVGEDPHNPPEEAVERLTADPYYRVLLHASIACFYLSFFVVAWTVGTQDLRWWAVVAITLASGATTGAALTVGHELGHKQSRVDRFAATVINALPGYGHFCVEHNRGHHGDVATPADAASARFGETVYAFSLREQPGALRRGLAIEAERLRRKGYRFWSWQNEILRGYALTLLIWGVVVVAFGWIMIPFLLAHTYIAWWQLTLANYVEHYGLLRSRRPDGRYLPCEPRHSWNTNHIVSNLLLFHLQRHSDHHANPLRPYQALRNYDDLPRLPSGYPGTYVLALIPALWFRVMDPKVLAWAGGDIAKVNRG